MLARARSFFAERDVLEVDCPALSAQASIDAHIDLMRVAYQDKTIGYLHSSPEYGMKRLLSEKCGDIYQMSHVFRAGEMGPLHNPEFTMVEWYRLALSFEEMIEEALDFTRLFLGQLPSHALSYREALLQFAKIDYLQANEKELIACAEKNKLGLPPESKQWDKDTLLQCLVTFLVEPHLGKNELFVLYDFPASQAALAETQGYVAKRFEIYYRGIELANGYKELSDAKEQRRRLLASNTQRVKLGKESLPIDEAFLKALEKGLPPCCGVAVGFDRLLMLRMHKKSVHEVLPSC